MRTTLRPFCDGLRHDAYLSGPMTGLPNFNYDAFEEAARVLRGRYDYDVFSPHETFGGDQTLPYETYLRADVRAVAVSRFIATLPGYHASPGASLELMLARSLGMQHFIYRDGLLLRPLIVGFVGYAGSGKDTAAGLLQKHLDSECVSFAAPLKSVLKAVNPLVESRWPQWVGPERLSSLLSKARLDTLKRTRPAVRRYLQRLGVAVRDYVGEAVWVDAAMKRADTIWSTTGKAVLVTDVRFDNEVEAIRQRGGFLIHVKRSGASPAGDHVSETLPERIKDAVIVSNDGTLEALERVMEGIASVLRDYAFDVPLPGALRFADPFQAN